MENDNIGEAAWEEALQPHNWEYNANFDGWEGTDEYHAFDLHLKTPHVWFEAAQVVSEVDKPYRTIFDLDPRSDLQLPQSA